MCQSLFLLSRFYFRILIFFIRVKGNSIARIRPILKIFDERFANNPTFSKIVVQKAGWAAFKEKSSDAASKEPYQEPFIPHFANPFLIISIRAAIHFFSRRRAVISFFFSSNFSFSGASLFIEVRVSTLDSFGHCEV